MGRFRIPDSGFRQRRLDSRLENKRDLRKKTWKENIGIRSICLGNWIAGFKGKADGN